MSAILIVDDDQSLVTMLSRQVDRSGHQPHGAATLQEGLLLARQGHYDLVFLDVQMPDGNGLDYLPLFHSVASQPEVIIITGQGDPDGAAKAIHSGAWGYIEKPHVLKDLTLHMTRALQYRLGKERPATVRALQRQDIIGNSPALASCLDQLAAAAPSDMAVLISGETGTGKELFARALHANSPRSANSFVVVDCSCLPETLIESTLFGHSKGAFTGAGQATDGLVRQAHGGTLFLDEVGELPLQVQKKFLRVLQEHRFRPVGSESEEESDFRLVAATNRDLEQMVKDGSFRSDLLYRLQGFTLQLPPLRQRLDDIRSLTTHLVERLCHRYSCETKGFGVDFEATLAAYQWPGNVRELFQVLEQAFTVALHSPTLFPNHLPQHIRICQAQTAMDSESNAAPTTVAAPELQPWRQYKVAMENDYLRRLLDQTKGNISAASRLAGVSRTHLYQMLSKHGLGES